MAAVGHEAGFSFFLFVMKAISHSIQEKYFGSQNAWASIIKMHWKQRKHSKAVLMIYVYYYHNPQKADEGLRKTFYVSIILYIHIYDFLKTLSCCLLLFFTALIA